MCGVPPMVSRMLLAFMGDFLLKGRIVAQRRAAVSGQPGHQAPLLGHAP